MVKHTINGRNITEDSLKTMSTKMATGKYKFYNPICECGYKMTINQAYQLLAHNDCNDKGQFKCPTCAKKIMPTIAIRRRRIFKIKYHGKILWKSNEPINRETAKNELEKCDIIHCPICNKTPNWYSVIYKWPFSDNKNIRTIEFPDDWVCCNNNRTLPTDIIYNNKIYHFNVNRELASQFMADKHIIECCECHKKLEYADIRRLIASHDSNNWIIKNKTKLFNYDTCNDIYKLCSECLTKHNIKSWTNRIKKNNDNYVLNELLRWNKLDKFYNDISGYISNDNKKFHMYSKLWKEFESIGIKPILYFTYLKTLKIKYDFKGKHHLMPIAVFPKYDNVRVICNNYQHLFLHLLLAIDIYKNRFNIEKYSNMHCRLIHGFIYMCRLHVKYIKDDNEWQNIKRKLNKIFKMNKIIKSV